MSRLIDADELIKCIPAEELVSRMAIANAHTIEQKTGKWINHLNDDGHHIADCSECGHALQWFDDEDEPKFCCMCGSYNGGVK